MVIGLSRERIFDPVQPGGIPTGPINEHAEHPEALPEILFHFATLLDPLALNRPYGFTTMIS